MSSDSTSTYIPPQPHSAFPVSDQQQSQQPFLRANADSSAPSPSASTFPSKYRPVPLPPVAVSSSSSSSFQPPSSSASGYVNHMSANNYNYNNNINNNNNNYSVNNNYPNSVPYQQPLPLPLANGNGSLLYFSRPARRYLITFLSLLPFLVSFILLTISATQSHWIYTHLSNSYNHLSLIAYDGPFNLCYPTASNLDSCSEHELSEDDMETWTSICAKGNVFFIALPSSGKYDECEEMSRWKATRGLLITGIIFNFITACFIPIRILIGDRVKLNRMIFLGISIVSYSFSFLTALFSFLAPLLFTLILKARISYVSLSSLPPQASFSISMAYGLGISWAGAALSIVGFAFFMFVSLYLMRRPTAIVIGNGNGNDMPLSMGVNENMNRGMNIQNPGYQRI